MRLLAALLSFLLPALALACPTCGREEVASAWYILAGFIAIPVLVAGAVALLIVKHLRAEEAPALDEPKQRDPEPV